VVPLKTAGRARYGPLGVVSGSNPGAFWLYVDWDTASVVVHDESHSQGGTQVTTRQVIGPMHGLCLLHCPYRNRVQQIFRSLQLSWLHSQLQATQESLQVPEPPQLHPPQLAVLQSM
jgi:hypothetical protein